MREKATSSDTIVTLERRARERMQVPLPARFLTVVGEEVECLTIDISASGASFKTARPPRIGEPVIAYVKDLGRIQGVAVRHLSNGFAMTISGTALKIQRMTEKLAQITGLPERRLFQRVELEGAQIVLKTPSGEELTVDIIDISARGIAFRGALALQLGDRVEIGGRAAVVARLIEDGAAASFL